MQSFIPDSVSTEQLEALSTKKDLPDWDGSFDTAFDIGHGIIESIPTDMYLTPGHVQSLAIKALINAEIQYEHLAEHFEEEDPEISASCKRRSVVIHTLVKALVNELCS